MTVDRHPTNLEQGRAFEADLIFKGPGVRISIVAAAGTTPQTQAGYIRADCLMPFRKFPLPDREQAIYSLFGCVGNSIKKAKQSH